MKKVKGGALIYSLFIVLVIGTMVNLILMISQYSSQNVIGFQQSIQLNKSLSSGIELLLSKDEFQSLNSEKEFSLFSNEQNKITTKRMQWGLYEVIGVKNTTNSYLKYGILGYESKENTSLYLTNTNQSLKVAGNTRLEGDCWLPQKGVERGNISGNPYKGNKLIYGNKRESNKSLPQVNEDLLIYLSQKENWLDSILLWNDYTDSLQQSFSQKTLHYISSNAITLTNQTIKGNIIIESSKEICISANANLGNIIVKAPYISIDNQYKGALQLQARDSITIGQEVYLDYPSSITLYDTKSVNDSAGYITIGKGSIIYGELLAIQKEYNYRDKISIKISPQVTITGNIYVNGVVDLTNVVINGSVYCQQFYLKKGGSVQQNTLLDVTISNKKRSENYLGGDLFKTQELKHKNIIDWIE